MAVALADLCIYTIKHSDDLVEGLSDTFHEKKVWATAKRLLEEARGRQEALAVVFSPAEQTRDIVAWALLEAIDFTPDGTDYRFSNMKLLPEPRPRKTTLRKRNGKPVSGNFIRPYAICRRPSFLAEE
jgi:hypothetical protein